MVRFEKKIISIMRTKKDTECEMALCMNMLVVSLRDMLSSGSNYYTKKCKKDAKTWLSTHDETYFSFSIVCNYLFPDVDEELLRRKLKRMLKNKRIKGTRNLVKILTEINDDTR